MTGISVLAILAAIIVLVAFWLVAMYNGLITLRNRTEEAWSDIDVQLKRRHDLIPNLVESVKGYMQHEKGLLEKVTAYRSEAISAQASGDKEKLAMAENQLGTALGNLRIAFEAYPNLKADQNMAKLMDELSDTENKIQASRRFYNGQVRDFNTRLETFPTNIFGKHLNFTKFAFFEIEDKTERENVQVKF